MRANVLTTEQVEHLRQLLHAEEQRLLGEAARARGRHSELMQAQPAGEERDRGEEATSSALADVEYAIDRHLQRERLQLAAAQARLGAGTLGVCAECGAPIGYLRLVASPTADRCVRCQAAFEQTLSG